MTNTALDDSHTASIGDLKNLSPNAQIMVKSAVISAWAGLQVTSKEQHYLVEVVRPHITVLAPLWLSSLKDYARLRFAPDDALNNGLSLSGDIDVFTGDADRPAVLSVSHFIIRGFIRLTGDSSTRTPG